MQCTECNKELRQVPAGVSRSTGKPYKAFWACPDRHKQASRQEQPQDNGKQDAAREMIELLAEIRDGILQLQSIELDIKQILFSMVQTKGKQEIGKPFDTQKKEPYFSSPPKSQDADIPIVEETGAPEPEGGYPF